MKQEIRDMLERIRKNNAWPEDDLLVVIHMKQKDRVKIVDALERLGLKDQDAVEIVPE